MQKRTVIYARTASDRLNTDHREIAHLSGKIAGGGQTVADLYTDDARINGRGRNAGWRKLLTDVATIQQIVLADPGDLPGKTVQDLLSILGTLADHGISISVPSLGVDTACGSAAVLDLISAYRRAKRAAAIRLGQYRARANGTHIGRPRIPGSVRSNIVAALAAGGGIRPTARRFRVSPAFVVAIRQEIGGTVPLRRAA